MGRYPFPQGFRLHCGERRGYTGTIIGKAILLSDSNHREECHMRRFNSGCGWVLAIAVALGVLVPAGRLLGDEGAPLVL